MSPRDDGKRSSVVVEAGGGPWGVTGVTRGGVGMGHNRGGGCGNTFRSRARAVLYSDSRSVSPLRALESRSRAVNSLRAEDSRWYRTPWSNLTTPPPTPTPTIHHPTISHSA